MQIPGEYIISRIFQEFSLWHDNGRGYILAYEYSLRRQDMKSILIKAVIVAAILIAVMPEASQAADAVMGKVDVSFEYQRQSGSGSNQFAVWVEDASGAVIKTLFVTNFTAGRGGWKYRKQSLPQWVTSSGIADMSPEEVDAVTKATPSSGTVAVSWDCRDESGAPVPAGEYTVILEATLRGENGVVYRATVDIGGAAKSVAPEPQYVGSGEAERDMMRNVRIDYMKQ